MKLICYPTSGPAPLIVPAPLERAWMDETPEGFAYRCLPLNIANAHGWFILNDAPLVAQWNGNPGLEGINIEAEEVPGRSIHAISHFGFGVLTFHVRGLFRTEPGYDLFVTGPTNSIKDGIQALSGVVETDWSTATFTMNWRFTRKHTPVAFEANEPICMIFPVKRGFVESVEPEIRDMASDPELRQAYLEWAESRGAFNEDLQVEGSAAQKQKWQKEYFRGQTGGESKIADHRTKLRVKPFKEV